MCDLTFPADFPKDQPLMYQQKRKTDHLPERSLDSKAIKTDKKLAAVISEKLDQALTTPQAEPTTTPLRDAKKKTAYSYKKAPSTDI